jgi:hypothetical protein
MLTSKAEKDRGKMKSALPCEAQFVRYNGRIAIIAEKSGLD